VGDQRKVAQKKRDATMVKKCERFIMLLGQMMMSQFSKEYGLHEMPEKRCDDSVESVCAVIRAEPKKSLQKVEAGPILPVPYFGAASSRWLCLDAQEEKQPSLDGVEEPAVFPVPRRASITTRS
jgi:hypothetical protein